jgi:2-deoxy-D-gluconate 3-dehydrogenase
MGVFAGKTAVVAGASSGIGQAVALRLGEAGAHVFAAGHRAVALASTVGAISGPAVRATAVVLADLRDPGAVRAWSTQR